MAKRVLLKLSGESFSSSQKSLSAEKLQTVAEQIINASKSGIEIALVVGGGNFLRGDSTNLKDSSNTDLLRRHTKDQMGMLSTVLNALALRDAFETLGKSAYIFSAIPILGIVETFNIQRAVSKLKSGNIVIFAGGTGNPFVTTDSAASLRSIEINADILLKATTVDAVYNKDPKLHKDAVPYKTLTYDQVLQQELKIMDLNAFWQCRNYGIPIRIFNVFKKDMLYKVLLGAKEGTLIS
ncbi:MAG: UMP kinase [Thiotrichales bacterium]|nr:MAG: UMP kinase [Thiotrichales bacterium]